MHKQPQHGFTLMEVVVATSIFAVTVTLMLTLFNFTLRIQRRTDALRQVSQTVRNVGEFLVKEIRNGQIDYNISDGQIARAPIADPATLCPPAATLSGNDAGKTYYNSSTSSLITNRFALVNLEGERECIAYDAVNQKLVITKENVGTEDLTPSNVKITFAQFNVRPVKDPYVSAGSGGYVEVQPVVSILLKARVTLLTGEIREIAYQTSISTSVYNIPSNP